jgi:hypothetical protein
MKRPGKALLAITLLSPALGWAACDVRSGPATTALVELYTSEGCSSCPPADKRLAEFPSGTHPSGNVVPLSLHVDYWDDLGWKDPFSQSRFSERQSWLVHANGHKTVFTPHFFVSGTEVRDWRGDLARELKRVNAEPARASIRLHAEMTPDGTISIAGSATPAGASTKPAAALFIAVTEDKLVSNVSAGENRGVTLSHDHVVREWIGPIPLERGDTRFKRTVIARRDWNAAQLNVAAFVQDLGSGQVLQAVDASQCLR